MLSLDELDDIPTQTMLYHGIAAMADRHLYQREARLIRLDAYVGYDQQEGYAIYYDRPGGFKTQKAIISLTGNVLDIGLMCEGRNLVPLAWP